MTILNADERADAVRALRNGQSPRSLARLIVQSDPYQGEISPEWQKAYIEAGYIRPAAPRSFEDVLAEINDLAVKWPRWSQPPVVPALSAAERAENFITAASEYVSDLQDAADEINRRIDALLDPPAIPPALDDDDRLADEINSRDAQVEINLLLDRRAELKRAVAKHLKAITRHKNTLGV